MLTKTDSRAICFTEARKILEKRKISEFAEEQKRTLDYLRAMPAMAGKDCDTAKEELAKIEGIKDHQIAMVLSLFPKTSEEMEIIFSKERINLKKEQVSTIL